MTESKIAFIKQTTSPKFLGKCRETLIKLLAEKVNVTLTVVEASLIKEVFDIGLERIRSNKK